MVSASLFSIGVTNAYFLNASVMHRLYLCCIPAANIGPKQSAWIYMFGWSGAGHGKSGDGLAMEDLPCWHLRQVLVYRRMLQ
jgi:hypothetical protein